MKVAVTDNRKTTRPLYIQGLKYILSSGKRHLFDVDEKTFDRLSKSGFLTVECLEETVTQTESSEEIESSLIGSESDKESEVYTRNDKVSEIVEMDPDSSAEKCDSDSCEEIKEKVDYQFMTVQQLKDLLTENNIDISNARKRKELISLAEEKLG